MNIGSIIKIKREKAGLTQREAAKLSGVSHSYLSEIENGKTKAIPTDEILSLLAKTFSLNEDEKKELFSATAYERTPQIIKNELSKLYEEKKKLKEIISENSNIKEPQNFIESKIKSYVYNNVSAGNGKYLYDKEEIEVEIPEIIKSSSDIIYFRVSGNSMEPDIKNGSLVMVKKGEIPENGKEGVFVLEGEWFVKVFRKTENMVILSSLNKDYKNIEIDVKKDFEFSCIGKVIGVLNFR